MTGQQNTLDLDGGKVAKVSKIFRWEAGKMEE